MDIAKTVTGNSKTIKFTMAHRIDNLTAIAIIYDFTPKYNMAI